MVKWIFMVAVLVFLISLPVIAASNDLQPSDAEKEPLICKADPVAVSDIELQRGCCSHHSGVCGCQNGRTICCDGALSPSCKCN